MHIIREITLRIHFLSKGPYMVGFMLFLTVTQKVSRVWGPGTNYWYSIWWYTSSIHPPSWNISWVAPEDYLCCVDVLNPTILRGKGDSTVDWREKNVYTISFHTIFVILILFPFLLGGWIQRSTLSLCNKEYPQVAIRVVSRHCVIKGVRRQWNYA